MKQTSTSPNHTEAGSHATHRLTDIRILVSGLGQPVLTNGTGSVSGTTLSCNGTLVAGQNFDVDGFYDIHVGGHLKYADVPYLGTDSQDPPWTFGVSA